MSKIVLSHIDRVYYNGKGQGNHVLKDLNLVIEDGDFLTLLGPSGCGKTTTLRVVAGLDNPQNGTMTIDGEEIINTANAYFAPPSKRGLNLVFQSYALWPHMTVRENVTFGLKIQKLPKEEIEKRLNDALRMMRITEFIDRYPNELSGGQQQRVAIARAVASNPKLLLLDEPLSNLDAKLRVEMRSELQRIHKELGTTIIYVTHDQTEALTMSTRIALFRRGELAQVATPMELYMNPVNLEAADFIGNPTINFMKAKAIKTKEKLTVTYELGTVDFPLEDMTDQEVPENEEFDAVVAIRPEQIRIVDEDKEGAIPVKVYSNQPAGSETIVSLHATDESENIMLCKMIGLVNYDMDSTVYIKISPKKINVYDAKSTNLIKRTR